MPEKTTLMRTLLREYNRNPAIFFEIPFKQVQYVPQFHNVNSDFPLEIQDFVGLGLQKYWFLWLTRREKRQIYQALKITDLLKISQEPLGEASGGEQQRAFLAQALVANPLLLILDETTASLDTDGKIMLLRAVVKEIKHHHLVVMFITHDPSLIRKFGDYELKINHRRGTMRKLGRQR